LKSTDSDSLITSQVRHQHARMRYWDDVACKTDSVSIGWAAYYHRRLNEIYQFLVPPGQRVLEIGCGRGDLLAAVKPSLGVGVDFSREMLKRAVHPYPELHFVQADAQLNSLSAKFDVIILSDLVNDLWNVQAVFEQIAPLCHLQTRIISNLYSRLWELPLKVAARLGLAMPAVEQNWLTVDDVSNMLYLTGFEVIRAWREIIWPLATPVLHSLLNRFIGKLWPFNLFALTNFVIARPHPAPETRAPLVSVIVPARNEAGHISQIFRRIPEMGRGTELVFVEGHSKDDTYLTIEREIASHPERRCQLLRQTGTGKGDAVRMGFSHASGELLMILDADLTVPPEELPRFYDAAYSGKAEFVNGVRLVYPMEKQAMRFFNLVGNKFFSLAFSRLLGQPVKDTLCGTKVLWRRAYGIIAANREYFGDFDPFGDFDLLFGAAKANLKMVDLPIRYQERQYGTTNIQRWKHGWLLLRMVIFAAGRIKFV
jgi:SAM-dependent methyltransferase